MPVALENPLLKKMRLKPGQKLLLLNAPAALAAELREQPDVPVLTSPAPADAALLFALNQAELSEVAPLALPFLPHDSLVWIAYPKGSSGIKTDINRDKGWSVVTATGLEAVASVAIDETWSALRFRPAELVKSSGNCEPPRVPGQPRILHVPHDLLAALEQHPEAQETFNGFAYTHRKEYVQWIEEAKKPETRANRIAKTIGLLKEGRKSR